MFCIKSDVINLESIEKYGFETVWMNMDDGPYWVILLMYGSHDMRHTGFRRLTVVNGTSRKWGVTHFKYSMKIYIRKYHFNIKGAHHLITKLFFSFVVAFHAHLVYFPPLYNAALLAAFNIQIFTKHNQSSIFIIVFVQNELNDFMYACDGALLILCVTLTITLIYCDLRPCTCSLGTCAMIKTTL